MWNFGLDRLLLVVVLNISFHHANFNNCLTNCNFVSWVPARLGGKKLSRLGFLLPLVGGDGCFYLISFLKRFFKRLLYSLLWSLSCFLSWALLVFSPLLFLYILPNNCNSKCLVWYSHLWDKSFISRNINYADQNKLCNVTKAISFWVVCTQNLNPGPFHCSAWAISASLLFLCLALTQIQHTHFIYMFFLKSLCESLEVGRLETILKKEKKKITPILHTSLYSAPVRLLSIRYLTHAMLLTDKNRISVPIFSAHKEFLHISSNMGHLWCP